MYSLFLCPSVCLLDTISQNGNDTAETQNWKIREESGSAKNTGLAIAESKRIHKFKKM